MISDSDRQAILDLFTRFTIAVDAGDADGWADAFAEDGAFITPTATTEGREAIRALATRVIGNRPEGVWGPGQHRLSNILIQGDGDTARGFSYVEWAAKHKETEKNEIALLAVYIDDLRKVDGEWYLARRQLKPQVPALSDIWAD